MNARNCGSDEAPVARQQISAAGWAMFVVMLLFCWPLFWIGLLMTEDYMACVDCGRRMN